MSCLIWISPCLFLNLIFIHIVEDFMAQEDIFKSSMQPVLTVAIKKEISAKVW